MKKRKSKKNSAVTVMGWLAFVLIIANLYLGMKFANFAKQLEIPLWGSVHSGAFQLSCFFFVNCAFLGISTTLWRRGR